MLIYDRRRCRPLPGSELRRRLTIAQRARLSFLESSGWNLMFLRDEPANVFVARDGQQAMISPDGTVLTVRGLVARPEDRPPVVADEDRATAAA